MGDSNEKDDREAVSIRGYALSRQVSYETVRRQVTRYKKDLKGHTKRVNNAIMLDGFAQDFLDGHRMKREITVEVQASDEETRRKIEQLRNDLERSQTTIIDLQTRLLKQIEENKESTLLIETGKIKTEALEENIKKLRTSLDEKEAELKKREEDLRQKEEELQSFKPSLFGFFRREK